MKNFFSIVLCIGAFFLTAESPTFSRPSTDSASLTSTGTSTNCATPSTPLAAPVPAVKSAHPEKTWKTVVNEDGVRIESKASGLDNLLSFKAYTQIPAKRERIQQEILNVKEYIHWIPRTVEIVILKESDPKKEAFFFGTGKGFFPFLQDRNLLVRLGVKEETPSHSLLVMERIQPEAVPKVPPISGVLIPYIRLEWGLYDSTPGQTSVTLSLTADPGGMIPDWIVNLAMQKYPLHTLQALRKRSQIQPVK